MGGDVAGRDGVEIDRWGIAPSIAFGLGTPTRVTLSYSRLENKDMPDLGFPFKKAIWIGLFSEVDRDTFSRSSRGLPYTWHICNRQRRARRE